MKRLWRAAIVAAATALAGTASAQMGPPATGGPPTAAKPGAPVKPAKPPRTAIGRDVVNAQGETIGKVKTIVGTQVIVSVGDFLGVPDRDVALPWEKLSVTGSGNKLRLQTRLTREQLKAIMPYRSSAAPAPAPALPLV